MNEPTGEVKLEPTPEDEGHPELTKEKRTRRTFFPLLIELANTRQQMVVKGMKDIPVRQAFTIMETNYVPSWKSANQE